MGQPAGDALGTGKQDEGKTVPGRLVANQRTVLKLQAWHGNFRLPFRVRPGHLAGARQHRFRFAVAPPRRGHLTRTSAIPIRRRTRASRALRASKVSSMTACAPPSMSCSSLSSRCIRMRLPAGTGAGKRTLLTP